MSTINRARSLMRRARRVGFEDPSRQFRLDHDPVQRLGERIDRDVFSGGPVNNFSLIGRLALITLLKLGLTPESKLLDIGCGSLRCGYWLIHFLERSGYCGIEPNREMLEKGRAVLLSEDLVARKAPRFDHNDTFDFSPFGIEFDYLLARSIWSHASKTQIETMLDGFVEHGADDATFLTSYLKPQAGQQDYIGDRWIGLSHRSAEKGLVQHSFDWIAEQCAHRGLVVEELEFDAVDQIWLRIVK